MAAEKAHISVSAYGKYERGEMLPIKRTVRRLAAALHDKNGDLELLRKVEIDFQHGTILYESEQSVGERLKELRLNNRMTCSGLSCICGIPAELIRSYETDTVKPPVSDLKKLAKAFDDDVFELLCLIVRDNFFLAEEIPDDSDEESCAESGNISEAVNALYKAAENEGLNVQIIINKPCKA